MWLLAEVSNTADALLQNGALGALVLILLPFGYRAYKDQKERADRLEGELREQNRIIQEKLVTELSRVSVATADVLRTVVRRELP